MRGLVLLVLACALAAGESTRPPTLVTAGLQGCQVVLPAGWVKDATVSSRTATWRAPGDPEPGAEATEEAHQAWTRAQRRRPAVTIGWQAVEADGTAAGLIDESWAVLERLAVTAGRIGEPKTEVHDGRTWTVQDYRFTLADEAWRQRVMVTVDPAARKAWTVTLSAGDAHWNEATAGLVLRPAIISGP